MDPRANHLQVLGLGHDASWDEVQQAYRDLMRVWHPDRFPNDARLQKRAQEQSQRINHAMSELRKFGKDYKPPPPDKTRPSTNTTHRAHDQSPPRYDFRATRPDHFTIPPLFVLQRPLASLLRLAGSSAIVAVALHALARSSEERLGAVCAASFLFFFLDVAIKNFVLLVFPRPILTVDQRGLHAMQAGRLHWPDIQHAWPIQSARIRALNVTYSPHYIKRQNPFRRARLYLCSIAGSPHLVISFRGLNHDPVHVLSSMKLRQIHNELIFDQPSPTRSIPLVATHLLSIACVCFVLLRCVSREELTPLDWIPYVIPFVAFRTSHFLVRLRGGE